MQKNQLAPHVVESELKGMPELVDTTTSGSSSTPVVSSSATSSSTDQPATTSPTPPQREKPTQDETRYEGTVKSFVGISGYGFIESEEAQKVYGRDVFLHRLQAKGLCVGQKVSFGVSINAQGMPQARDIKTISAKIPGMEVWLLGSPPDRVRKGDSNNSSSNTSGGIGPNNPIPRNGNGTSTKTVKHGYSNMRAHSTTNNGHTKGTPRSLAAPFPEALPANSFPTLPVASTAIPQSIIPHAAPAMVVPAAQPIKPAQPAIPYIPVAPMTVAPGPYIVLPTAAPPRALPPHHIYTALVPDVHGLHQQL